MSQYSLVSMFTNFSVCMGTSCKNCLLQVACSTPASCTLHDSMLAQHAHWALCNFAPLLHKSTPLYKPKAHVGCLHPHQRHSARCQGAATSSAARPEPGSTDCIVIKLRHQNTAEPQPPQVGSAPHLPWGAVAQSMAVPKPDQACTALLMTLHSAALQVERGLGSLQQVHFGNSAGSAAVPRPHACTI